MWGVGFKIKSKFGHFRNPYTTTFKQSYPFPPKPTIIGMIGAICGWDEKIVIEKMNKFKIAIPFWNNKGKTIEFIFIIRHGKVASNQRFGPERFEILLYPEFELLIFESDKEIVKEIEERIKKGDFVFPLFMGKNEFIISEIEVTRSLFETELRRINIPSGIIFVENNYIPEFYSVKEKIPPPEIFIGVPKLLSLSNGKRIQKEVCLALASKAPIRVVEKLEGVKLNEFEYTVI